VQTKKVELSIFDYFKKKTAADVKAATEKKDDGAFVPTPDNKKPKSEVTALPKGNDLKKEIKQLERQGEDNLYGRFKPIRKSVRERNQNLNQLLHEDLRSLPNVTISKYEGKNFKRGLQPDQGEHPFPVSPRIGPYEIKDPIFGAKNYYWCSCGMSKS